MAGMTKPLRPIKPGLSNLGGGIKLLLYTLDQFTADVEWPKRADILTGKSVVPPTLITTETAARVIFDINKGVKMKSNGKGPTTNQVYDHSFEGAVVNGYTAEQNEALGNSYIGKFELDDYFINVNNLENGIEACYNYYLKNGQ